MGVLADWPAREGIVIVARSLPLFAGVEADADSPVDASALDFVLPDVEALSADLAVLPLFLPLWLARYAVVQGYREETTDNMGLVDVLFRSCCSFCTMSPISICSRALRTSEADTLLCCFWAAISCALV